MKFDQGSISPCFINTGKGKTGNYRMPVLCWAKRTFLMSHPLVSAFEIASTHWKSLVTGTETVVETLSSSVLNGLKFDFSVVAVKFQGLRTVQKRWLLLLVQQLLEKNELTSQKCSDPCLRRNWRDQQCHIFFLKEEKFKLNKVFKESLSEQTSLLVNTKKKSSWRTQGLKGSLQLLERCFGVSSELQDAQGRVPHRSFKSPLKTKLADI